MAHPQLDDLTAVVRRAFSPGGEGGVRLVIPSAELVVELMTFPNHIDDGYGKVQYITEDLLLLPR